MMDMFDKQIQLRMGQCNVRRWTDVLLALVEDAADPLGVLDLVTHTVPIAEAPGMYKTFQEWPRRQSRAHDQSRPLRHWSAAPTPARARHVAGDQRWSNPDPAGRVIQTCCHAGGITTSRDSRVGMHSQPRGERR